MLEGPKNSVLGLYDIIVGDSRHVGVNVLEQNPIESRVYPEFGMALYSLCFSVRSASLLYSFDDL